MISAAYCNYCDNIVCKLYCGKIGFRWVIRQTFTIHLAAYICVYGCMLIFSFDFSYI